jgi:acyl-CoA thioesterase-1
LAVVFACLVVWGGGASPAAAAAEALKIFILGDSLTAGYGVALGKSFPDQLQAALKARGHRVRVINGGVSGDTSAGGRARIGWALKDKPDAFIVALGGNDALRGIDPKSTRGNLDAILTRLGRAGVPVLLAGWKSPRNLGPEYVRAFEAIFPALARKHGVLFYPFILDGVALKPALNQRDGIHPNARGAARMVKGILPLVERLIARIGGEPGKGGRSRFTGEPRGGGP